MRENAMSGVITDMETRLVKNLETKSKDSGGAISYRAVSEYLDPEQFAREMEVLFGHYPIIVAHSSQLPNPGDFVTDDRLGPPLIITRTESGTIAAFLNICSHRNAIVETSACGHRDSFVCPYHHWSYGLDGSLLQIPDRKSFAELDAEKLGLRRVAAAEKYGLVFVRLAAGPAIDIDAYLGPLAEQMEMFSLQKHKFFDSKRTELKCNWKLSMEGSLETYHFNFLHAATGGAIYQSMSNLYDCYGDHQRFVMPSRKFMKARQADADLRPHILPTYFIFPNTTLTFTADHVMLVQIFPKGIHDCIFENALLTLGGAAEKGEQHWQRALELTQSVNAEDFLVIESIQRAYDTARPDQARPDQAPPDQARPDTAPPDQAIHGRYEQGLTDFHAACAQAITRFGAGQSAL